METLSFLSFLSWKVCGQVTDMPTYNATHRLPLASQRLTHAGVSGVCRYMEIAGNLYLWSDKGGFVYVSGFFLCFSLMSKLWEMDFPN